MPEKTPLTLLGLGSMGRALAGAAITAGHRTTVWNRSPGRADELAARGVIAAASLDDAITAGPVIISCLTDFAATRSVLEPVAARLAGRALITLNSGSPADARDFAAWAGDHDVRFLAGAIKNVPAAVGEPDTLLYYSGDRTVFGEHLGTLRVFGGDTVFLGDDADLAALYEMCVGSTLLPALIGFFHGAAALRSRGLPAASMVRFSGLWLDMIKSILPTYAQQIDEQDYTDAASSVNLFLAGETYERDLARETGIDASWQAPLWELIHRAAERGHGEHSITAVTEVLREPRT
jgi:3-hydroxyisobutyrate dehydrogenase-like beta-hydroxyacid dehydrogenase